MIDTEPLPLAEPEPALVAPQAPPAPLVEWLRRGARSAFFLRPDWRGLVATPGLLAGLLAAILMLAVIVERLAIDGAARFYWPALMAGWMGTAVTAWVCWLVVPKDGREYGAPSAAALFGMQAAQGLAIWCALLLVQTPLLRAGWLEPEQIGNWGAWLAGLAPMAWALAALAILLWRESQASAAVRGVSIAFVCAVAIVNVWGDPLRLWYADEPADAARAQPMKLTQELFEDQAATLDMQLAAIAPQRAGMIDIYALTFAPYADEEVFLRESRMVAGVMAERFDAQGRTLQLVNHRATLREFPWATTLNLQRAIEHFAKRMDRDEDILFIHLTSHGAHSGSLASSFWPLSTEALTPAALKAMLDAAGIRHRIVSVSACYSGSWLGPLASENSLVMTAADAEHTSYGCGRGSELTYFGRAMFDEQLRRHTRSFEIAHAQARTLIEQREKEAGKTDGYSNPQIALGAAMRQHLQRLESERTAAPR